MILLILTLSPCVREFFCFLVWGADNGQIGILYFTWKSRILECGCQI